MGSRPAALFLALVCLSAAANAQNATGGTGKGVVVAVIGSGIEYRHPALGGGFGPGNKVAGGWDFVDNDADPQDGTGTGTFAAGLIAAKSHVMTGVAPDATLLAYRVYPSGEYPKPEV